MTNNTNTWYINLPTAVKNIILWNTSRIKNLLPHMNIIQIFLWFYSPLFIFRKIQMLWFTNREVLQLLATILINWYFVFNKAKRCAYEGVRNVRFSENLVCFVFLLPLSWDSPFLSYYRHFLTPFRLKH